MAERDFYTRDGIKIHFVEEGKGMPIMLIHCIGGSLRLFKYQTDMLKNFCRVIAIDMRGHGTSQKPGFGYSISRMAADLKEFIECMGLRNICLVGYRTGCSIIWDYFELFGSENISKFIFIDGSPSVFKMPFWTVEENRNYGGAFDYDKFVNELSDLKDHIEGYSLLINLISHMEFNIENINTEDSIKKMIISDILKADSLAIYELLLNCGAHNYIDVIPKINKPSLVIGGVLDILGKSPALWLGENIKNSKTYIFNYIERHNNFMFHNEALELNNLLYTFIKE